MARGAGIGDLEISLRVQALARRAERVGLGSVSGDLSLSDSSDAGRLGGSSSGSGTNVRALSGVATNAGDIISPVGTSILRAAEAGVSSAPSSRGSDDAAAIHELRVLSNVSRPSTSGSVVEVIRGTRINQGRSAEETEHQARVLA